jgi:hypothetical protein
MATADVLPFRVSAIAQDYADSLREYREGAGANFDFGPTEAAVATFRQRAEQLEARMSGATDEALTRAANRLMLRVTRLLNPVLYQDLPGHLHDPALGSRSLPSLKAALTLGRLDPASDACRFAVAGLARRVNAVKIQLAEASELIEEFLAKTAALRKAS